MSTPDITATQTETSQSDSQLTPEEAIAKAEKRYRDTQAAYTKGQQALKAARAEADALKELITAQMSVNLTTEQRDELDDLKYSDPDAWRVKVNEYEQIARQETESRLAEVTTKAGETAGAEFELSRRQQVLEEFNESSEVKITDEIIANEVPPRITNKLANGEISFEDFLTEVHEYVTTGKVFKDEKTLGQPNLGKVSGGKSPSTDKAEESLTSSYAKDLY